MTISLQILISTIGEDGIKRVVEANHPSVEGVEYLVSWQLPDEDVAVPPELSSRNDFKIFKISNRGVSRNRNNAISNASAPLALIADDDVLYTPSQLRNAIIAGSQNPEASIITLKYYSDHPTKCYPANSINLKKKMPQDYFVSSIEIMLRPNAIKKAGLQFNEYFGLGSYFISGEEQLFINDALRAGLSVKFVPVVVGNHLNYTTSERYASSPAMTEAKGAMMALLFPWSWPLRLLTHTTTQKSKDRISYFRAWLRGVRRLTKLPHHRKQ